MRPAAFPLAAALALAGAGALAQGATDPVEKLRACSQMEGVARLDCLDQLSRQIAPPPNVAVAPAQATPPAPRPPVADTWVVSETTSPLDYSPIAIATATSPVGSDGATMSLSIQCRGGRTDIVVGGSALSRGTEDATITYRVNDGPPVPVAAGPSTTGVGMTLKVDAVRLLASLPPDGEIAIRVAGRHSVGAEGRFSLAGLKSARDRMTTPCKWQRN